MVARSELNFYIPIISLIVTFSISTQIRCDSNDCACYHVSMVHKINEFFAVFVNISIFMLLLVWAIMWHPPPKPSYLGNSIAIDLPAMDRVAVSLQDILIALGGPLEERALWALLYKACSLLEQELKR